MVSPIWSVVAEIDEARLVGMECESVPCKAFTQNAKDPLGIEEVLERQHGIVSEADKGTSPLAPWADPSVASRRRPSSRTPAFSHLSIIRRMTPSVTRRSRKSRRWECGIESKYFTMSISITQRSLWLMQAVCKVCNAD